MRAAMRRVLPPTEAILTFAVIHVAIDLLPRSFFYWLTREFDMQETWRETWKEAGGYHAPLILVYVVAALYGMYRVGAFHPVFRDGFRRWLVATPWTHKQRLPFGSIHLVWQDAVVVASLVALSYYDAAPQPFLVFYLVVAGWCVALADTLFESELRKYLYAMLFGAGLAVVLANNPVGWRVTLIGIYIVGLFGLSATLRKLRTYSVGSVERPWKGLVDNEKDRYVLWPYNIVGPYLDRQHVPTRDALAISLLAGWWLYVTLTVILTFTATQTDQFSEWEAWQALARNERLTPELVATAMAIVMTIVAVVRTIVYCSNRSPPISLLGRLFTFRWIIPGYDRVFVSPLLAFAIAIGGPIICRVVGILPSLYLPAVLTTACITVLCGGPSLRNWQLTGHYRAQPSYIQSAGDATLVSAG